MPVFLFPHSLKNLNSLNGEEYRERYKESAELQQIETVIEKEVNILKTWQKVLMWLGALAILWILIKILLKIQFSV